MILFISLFLVARGEEIIIIKCQTAKDCPDIYNLFPLVYKCIDNICVDVRLEPPYDMSISPKNVHK